ARKGRKAMGNPEWSIDEAKEGQLICSGGDTLSEAIKEAVKEGSIPLSKFYHDRVAFMIADSFLETCPVLHVTAEGDVEITEEVSGREYRSDPVRIDKDGNILKDGGLYYVHALKEHGVKVIPDPENLRS
nr:hypothetical protein [Lachnospiraceae bacterium]